MWRAREGCGDTGAHDAEVVAARGRLPATSWPCPAVGQAFSGPGALDPRAPRRATLRRLARTGPAELRGALRTLSRQFGLVAPAMLAAYRHKPGAGARMKRAVNRLDGKAIGQANAHVTTWIKVTASGSPGS